MSPADHRICPRVKTCQHVATQAECLRACQPATRPRWVPCSIPGCRGETRNRYCADHVPAVVS